MSDTEMESATGLVAPTVRRTVLLVSRAVRLRCPNCGGRPVLADWFHLRARCPECGLRFERGERDYFIGSMMFNLVLAELVFAAAFVGALLYTWPDVPWDTLEWAAPALMIAAPFALFPFSKLAWLAFDILLRPVSPAELEWHRAEPDAHYPASS